MPSSVIRTFRYDPHTGDLQVVFTSGRRYDCHGVPAELAEEMRLAFSKGAFFNRRIRDRFAFTRAAEGLPP